MPQPFLTCLQDNLERLPAAPRYFVAYSGGRDSHVLLHAMASLRGSLPGGLHAIHVNHGLSLQAAHWAGHCRSVCDALSVPLRVVTVDAGPERGESPEAAARHARYKAFSRLMATGDCLLTAHHQDDQAETLLLQLLRGSGPHGLAGMPFQTPFSRGLHARPLLDFTREQLGDYAAAQGLRWVEDPSNRDTGLRRNFIRHEIFPLLASQWPAAAETLSRSAAHCADAARLLDSLADDDLRQVRGAQSQQLDIEALSKLDEIRQRNVIRYWIRSQGFPLPQQSHLERLRHDVLQAAPDRMPLVCWADAEIRRYRDTLYLMRPLKDFDPKAVLPWDLRAPLQLPGGLGMLESAVEEGGGLALEAMRQDGVSVRFRQGGETCRPPGRGHAVALKKLFQEQGIPPWQRNRIPLLYVGEQLAAVVGVCNCEPFVVADGVSGVVVRLRPSLISPFPGDGIAKLKFFQFFPCNPAKSRFE